MKITKNIYVLNFWRHWSIKKSWYDNRISVDFESDHDMINFHIWIEILGIRMAGVFFNTYLCGSFSIQILNFSLAIDSSKLIERTEKLEV